MLFRSLRAQKIDLGGRKSWCESNDPHFAKKAAEAVGLYMAPPKTDGSLVFAVVSERVIFLASRDPHHLYGVANYVSRTLLTFRASRHFGGLSPVDDRPHAGLIGIHRPFPQSLELSQRLG